MNDEILIVPVNVRDMVYIQRKSDNRFLWPDGRWLPHVSVRGNGAYYANEAVARHVLAQYESK